MTTSAAQLVPIVNRALQSIGTRTTVTADELTSGGSNEALQAMVVVDDIRRDLLRMAPWASAQTQVNLGMVCAAPGTPENPSAGTDQWQPRVPPQDWLYEYAYPSDCLKAISIVPQGTRLPGFLNQIKFQVRSDRLYTPQNAYVINGGAGFFIGEIATLVPSNSALGAPTTVEITSLAQAFTTGFSPGYSSGVVTGVNILSGAFATPPDSYSAQAGSTGKGTGLILGVNYTYTNQRVIVTNQAQATLLYVVDLDDTGQMDSLFTSAWSDILASKLCLALTGDKAMANMLIKSANESIAQARVADENEEVEVHDITPDWIRARGTFGYDCSLWYRCDWGPYWPSV